MALEVWPATLPNASSEGYALARQASTVRTEMSAGPDRVRRVYTRTPTWLQLTWSMSGDQLKIFRGFWKTSIDHGASEFSMDLYLGDGTNFTTTRVRFKGQYTATYVAPGRWKVKGALELLDDPPLTEPS